jgi:hypothetical protein
MKRDEVRNIIKGLFVIGLVIYGLIKGAELLMPPKREAGPMVKCSVAYVTVNGKQYETFVTPDDRLSHFITFGNGMRVPWSEVTIKEEAFSVESLQRLNEALAIEAASKNR